MDALQHTATHCIALQRTATHCNAMHRTATYTCSDDTVDMSEWNTNNGDIFNENIFKDDWTHCITLQHAATHCNTLQHTATHCSTHMQRDTVDMREQNAKNEDIFKDD